jgi:hypothetical protein
VKVSLAIMAHPSRAPFVDDLLAELGDVPVAWSEPPDAEPGFREPVWRTNRAAMQLHTDAPFHCVLQDDVIPCPDFRRRIEELATGDYLYMLFFRKKRTWRDVNHLADSGDFTVRGRLLGPAVIYPTQRIPDIIRYCDKLGTELGSDDRVKRWASKRGVDTYVPIPSLVDHRVGRSLVGHPEHRVAWRVAS